MPLIYREREGRGEKKGRKIGIMEEGGEERRG
jgi:hypothetical protein